jgi:hypothetical protein
MLKLLTVATLFMSSLLAQIDEPLEVPYISYEIRTGKNFDVVYANCLTCHSFGYIINQGPQSKPYWAKKVDKMIVHFKAPITKEDASKITDYLFTHYGNGKKSEDLHASNTKEQ